MINENLSYKAIQEFYKGVMNATETASYKPQSGPITRSVIDELFSGDLVSGKTFTTTSPERIFTSSTSIST